MERFMKRRLLFTASLVVVLGLGLAVGYSIWKAKALSPQAYFERGKKYYDGKKYREATIEFLNALQKDARHRDARYFLVQSLLEDKDYQDAIGNLKALLEYYPDDTAANLELARVYLTGGAVQTDL